MRRREIGLKSHDAKAAHGRMLASALTGLPEGLCPVQHGQEAACWKEASLGSNAGYQNTLIHPPSGRDLADHAQGRQKVTITHIQRRESNRSF